MYGKQVPYTLTMSNILVTGAGGYIGSHAVLRLLQDGHHVIALDNFSRGYREPLEILSQYGELVVYEADLCNRESLENIFKKETIDVVMHFAALCNINESVENPNLYSRNNIDGTEHLLNTMVAHGVTALIFSSTCAVYGEARYLPIDEGHPINPANPYGESKHAAENIIATFGKDHGLRSVIFRYFNVCGADLEGEIGDSKKPSGLLVQNAVRAGLGLASFELTCPDVDTPDGTPIRDYIDVLDLVDAHVKALKYLKNMGQSAIFNLGNGKGWSVKEILAVVKKELGISFEIKKSDHIRKGEYAQVYAATQKAQAVLGWCPTRTLRDSILSLKQWYEKNPKGYKY